MTFDTYGLYVFVAQALSQAVQVFLSFRTQDVFVEAEQGFRRQGNSFVNVFGSLLNCGYRFAVTTFDTTLGFFVEVAVFPALAVVVTDDFLRLAAYGVAVFGVRFTCHCSA